MVHKHWIVYAAQAVFLLLLMIVPITFLRFGLNLELFAVTGDSFFLFIFLSSLWLLVCWITFFVMWTNNYLDALIVTNRRIVDVDQISLFSRRLSSFRVDRIQDITVEVHGPVATFLSYGNIQIETAGEGQKIRLHTIPRPEEVKRKILALHHTQSEKSPHSQL